MITICVTHTHTNTGSSIVTFSMSLRTLKTKKKTKVNNKKRHHTMESEGAEDTFVSIMMLFLPPKISMSTLKAKYKAYTIGLSEVP